MEEGLTDENINPITIDIFIDAIQQNENAFKYIPEEMKTYELCLLAVQKKGSNLKFVSEGMKTCSGISGRFATGSMI